MTQVRSSSAILLALALLGGGLLAATGPTPAAAGHSDSRTPPSGASAVIPPIVPLVAGNDWLVIQDNVPWFHDSVADALNAFGYRWDRIQSSQIPFTVLTDYRGIITVSDQGWSYYDNLFATKAALEAYVAAGGVFVAHSAQGGWNSWPVNPTPWIPGGAVAVDGYEDSLTVTAPSHHVVSGISSWDLSGWFYSTHGTITSLPVYSREIVNVAGGAPTYTAYPLGSGIVYVTQQTVEWAWGHGWWGGYRLLQNELDAINEVPTPIVDVPGLLGINGYSQSFDLGAAPGWLLSGLWHVSSCRAHSPTYALAYKTLPCPGDYNVGTTAGEAITPPISISAAAARAQLSFDSWYDTETGGHWDAKDVYVSNDGGVTWSHLGSELGNPTTWNHYDVDVSGYVGQTIHVKFVFDSRDDLYNSYEGWYVDNVKVTESFV